MATQLFYQPLTGTEIRLISIDTGKYEDPIRVRLQHFPLETSPAYIALSYVWGDSENPVSISVNEASFSITQNLYQALRQLRSQLCSEAEDTDPNSCISYFWADAICIDQLNNTEKAKEVLRMGTIYQSADRAVGWLGMDEDLNPEIIKRVFEEANNLYDIHLHRPPKDLQMVQWLSGVLPSMKELLGNDFNEFIETFFAILQRDFFKRIWIVQEAVLAKQMVLLIENKSTVALHYLWFVVASGPLLRTHFMEFQGSVPYDRIRAARNTRQSLMTMEDRMSLSAFAYRLDAILALSVDGSFMSTIPHDYVYALLGMAGAPENLPNNLKPDYSQTYGEVCFAYTKFLIEQTRNLNILDRLGPRALLGRIFVNEHENIPSWVPDLWIRPYICPKPDARASVSFSADGKCMTVQGVSLGNPHKIVQPQIMDAPFLPADERARKIENRILRESARLNMVSYDDVYLSWLFSFKANSTNELLPIEIVDRIFSKIKKDPFEASFEEIDEQEEEFEEAVFLVRQAFETSILWDAQFLTSDGFVGSLSYGSEYVRKDDVVCVLKSMLSAALLRPCGTAFRFVGTVELRCPLRESKFDEEFFLSHETRTFDIV